MNKNALILIASFIFAGRAHANDLSKSQVRDIAEQYIEAIEECNYEQWSQLMLNTSNWDKAHFIKHLNKVAVIKDTEVVDIDKTKTGFNISLRIQYEDDHRWDSCF